MILHTRGGLMTIRRYKRIIILCHSNYTYLFRTQKFQAVMIGSRRLMTLAFPPFLICRSTFGETPDSGRRFTRSKRQAMSFTWSQQRAFLRVIRTSRSKSVAGICARRSAGAATLWSVLRPFRQPQLSRSSPMAFTFIPTMTSSAPPRMLLRRLARS
jgi:hypothetical protein